MRSNAHRNVFFCLTNDNNVYIYIELKKKRERISHTHTFEDKKKEKKPKKLFSCFSLCLGQKQKKIYFTKQNRKKKIKNVFYKVCIYVSFV